jgi:hypothetical protein
LGVHLRITLPERTDLTSKCFDVTALPFDVDAWRARTTGAARRDVTVVASERLETVDGWPYTVVVSDLARPTGVVERRLHAFYEVLHWSAVVLIHGTVAAVDRARADLDEALRAARPDFTLPTAPTLAALWEWP